MDEFIKSLGIAEHGSFEGDKYVIDLADSNAYAKAFTVLEKSDKVDLDGDSTLVSPKVGELLFLSDDYDIRLVANYQEDIYKIIIEKGE